MGNKQTISQIKSIVRAGRASAHLDWSTRQALFAEALRACFMGYEELAKLILRDVINGNLGFESLARVTQIPSKSIHRMLSKVGNPTSKNLFHIVRAIAITEGFEIIVGVEKRIDKEKK